MHTQTQCGPLSIYSKYKHRPFVNSRQCLRAVSEAPPGDGQYLIGVLCVGVLRPMSLSFHTYAADVLLSFYKEKRETRFFPKIHAVKNVIWCAQTAGLLKMSFFFFPSCRAKKLDKTNELVFPYSHFCLHPHGGCEIVHLCICIKST